MKYRNQTIVKRDFGLVKGGMGYHMSSDVFIVNPSDRCQTDPRTGRHFAPAYRTLAEATAVADRIADDTLEAFKTLGCVPPADMLAKLTGNRPTR